ncbi:hypothetical protein LBMAG42_25820 [Deltaproteobacteria bacterium]|nr:hypothetical protein LBMAG42_25820 [Deltaproteobacteria bacterium]
MTRAAAARVAAIGGLVAACLCGPAWWAGELVGSPGAETLGHAWVQAWASAAWPAWPSGTESAAGASSWPVIDPLPTWIIAGAARVIGLTAAWNLLVAAGIVVAAVGGARLAKAAGGAPLFGAVAVPLMPVYLGSLTSGLTEDAMIGVVALALANALEGRWVRAGVWCGFAAWCGLYLGWMAGIGVAAIGIRAAKPAEILRSGPRMVGGALLALTLGLGAAAPFAGQIQASSVARPAPPPHEEFWRVNPWRGADVASFVSPGKVALEGAVLREHPVYLGFATVALAAVGGTPVGWGAAAVCVLVAPGDDLVLAGSPLGIHNPAATALHALPFGDRFRNHARLMLVGQVVLVAMASRGIARLRSVHRALPVVATLLVVAEVVWCSPARAPLPGTPAESPGIYAALAAAPAELPVRVVGAHNPQQPLFDQRAHGRRLLNNPNRPDPGRPHPESEIVVAFGEAVPRLTVELGVPDVVVADAAAWWPPNASETSAPP